MTLSPVQTKVARITAGERIPADEEVYTMRRAKQLWQWLRSTAAKLWQHTIHLTSKFASWLKKAKSQQAHDLIMPLGVLIGTVAFGLWSQSFTASLFAWQRALLLLRAFTKGTSRCLPHCENRRLYRRLKA